MIVLTDNEISLKQLEPSLAPILFGLIEPNRNYLREYLPWVDKTQKVQDVLSFIKYSQDHFADNKNPTFAVFYNGQIAGTCGLHPIVHEHGHTSLGYWIAEKFQGKGVMTRAVKLLLFHCFDTLKLNKVEIRCAIQNTKSAKIPERFGFRYDGILRENELCNGVMFDHKVYSLLKREWLAGI